MKVKEKLNLSTVICEVSKTRRNGLYSRREEVKAVFVCVVVRERVMYGHEMICMQLYLFWEISIGQCFMCRD